MTLLLIAFLLQSTPSMIMPPRISLRNPNTVTDVPKSLKKDYDKIWMRFLKGNEDSKVARDVEKALKKQRNFVPYLLIEAYIDLYGGKPEDAERQFTLVLMQNPSHPIALYYEAELAYARNDFAKANVFYTRLLAVDSTQPELEVKRQKTLLLAIDGLLRAAASAEREDRLADAEGLYRQALEIAPMEPVLHARLAALLMKQKKWEDALSHLHREIELGDASEEARRHEAEALVGLGRAEEARDVLEHLRQTGSRDDALERQVAELEDLGRWGADVDRFRAIVAAPAITREQLSAILARYFPQIMEFRQNLQIMTDSQNSWAGSEIQSVVGAGLLDVLPNHTFQPARIVMRGDLAVTMARLSRLLRLKSITAPPIPTPDLTSGNALYGDIQLALGYGLMTLDDAGNFGINAPVSGKEAVNAAEQMLRLLHEKAD